MSARRRAGAQVRPPSDAPGEVVAAPAEIGLVLGGGGARGLCHVGVMRVLEQLDIHPDVVSGTSMGGLVGAFVAAGYSAAELQEIATDVRWLRLIDWNPLSGRLLNTKGFEEWLTGLLPATFEELELPLVLTATNLKDGRIYYARTGDLVRALRATTAYPGVIEPVRIGGDTLVDGGLLNQIPVDGALLHGVRRVLAVNATPLTQVDHPGEDAGAPRRFRGGWSSLKELTRAADVMQAQLTMSRLSFYTPDLMIDPRIDGVEIGDFHKSRQAIEAGAAAALERSEELTRLFSRPAVQEPVADR